MRLWNKEMRLWNRETKSKAENMKNLPKLNQVPIIYVFLKFRICSVLTNIEQTSVKSINTIIWKEFYPVLFFSLHEF